MSHLLWSVLVLSTPLCQLLKFIRSVEMDSRLFHTHVVSRLGLGSQGCDTILQALAAGSAIAMQTEMPCPWNLQSDWLRTFSASHYSSKRTSPALRILTTLAVDPLGWIERPQPMLRTNHTCVPPPMLLRPSARRSGSAGDAYILRAQCPRLVARQT